MRCPGCGEEMEPGFLQSGQRMVWIKTPHKISLLTKKVKYYRKITFLRAFPLRHIFVSHVKKCSLIIQHLITRKNKRKVYCLYHSSGVIRGFFNSQ